MNIELLEQPSTELTVQYRAVLALSSNKTRADLAALVLNSAHIIEIKNRAGRDECHSATMALVKARTAISAKGKTARDDATKFCKAVISEEASLTEITTPEEKRLRAMTDAWDAKEAQAKEKLLADERARITNIHLRIATIHEYKVLANGCRTAARVDELLGKLARIELAEFDEFSDEATNAHLDAMQRVEAILIERHADEKEQARIKAEQDAAAAKLKAERAELDAAIAAQAVIEKRNRDAAVAEADRLATERQAFADQQAAARKLEQAKADEVSRIEREAIAAGVAKAKSEQQEVESARKAQQVEDDLIAADIEVKLLPKHIPDREVLRAIEIYFSVDAKRAFGMLCRVNTKLLQKLLIDEI